ncbi:MAG: hypothetical protein V1720_08690 [bacterium]
MTTMIDTLFIDDFEVITTKGTEGKKVYYFQFFENDPNKYVYHGMENGKGFVKVYNINKPTYFTPGPVICIKVSNDNPDLIYFSMLVLFYSTDRGKTWDIKNNMHTGKFVSNPYDNSHIFRIGYDEEYQFYLLEKSFDGGSSFNLISNWITFAGFDDKFINTV